MDRQDSINQLDYLPHGFKLPPMSPFGDQRASYPAAKLLNDDSVLFLGGMHCYGTAIKRAHYVAVVVCQKGSISYHTCHDLGMIELPWEDNQILRWDKGADKVYCASELKIESAQEENGSFPHAVWVEIILCDQAVPLNDGHRTTVLERSQMLDEMLVAIDTRKKERWKTRARSRRRDHRSREEASKKTALFRKRQKRRMTTDEALRFVTKLLS
ncbi:hypothetical protein PENTCL1PPCAC_1662 [Pristionchus entomophagus]|uniref:Uncharacterized protein n=1 Tax=Pristionchus entomophagus TaxID=358040 RepID=A0AAV5SAR5_9BILA|nr:hypothetical protein PENTCL1PPCAC_1662 [Pristionchus entomophagus]